MSILLLICTLISSFRCSALPQTLQQSLNSTRMDPIQQEICLSASEELVSTLDGLLRCCNKCPAGEGMLQLCTNQTQTVCRPCQEGSEFSLEASATAKCMQCKQCQELHPFAKFRKHCTPTSDAVCDCVSGYFFIEAHSTCQSCTKCPPGQGAEKPCEWNENSVCKPCAEGTWSSTDSATDRCQTCRKCKPGQIEMRPCTATQNTLCCPLHNPNCEDTFEGEEFDESHNYKHDYDLWPTPHRPRALISPTAADAVVLLNMLHPLPHRTVPVIWVSVNVWVLEL
ncbi:Tumor necrosi factor receptor superfamily member 16 [Taenia crassiceps]|uniref:Tumor necrosi factor receptor superfamily member 16 n=1 Tax=Taenia crassiceps TaxID=6207 RepID=A0ABR4QJ49_9CEST